MREHSEGGEMIRETACSGTTFPDIQQRKRHCDANRNGVECDMRLGRTIHLAASLAAMGFAVGCGADMSTSPSPSPSVTASSPPPPLTSTLTLTASPSCDVVT